jgi:hypothetical protein
MRTEEHPADGLYGQFRDVLYDADGRVVWDHGWQRNAIVLDCRKLLAGFMRGAPTTTTGILELQFGAGLSSWDAAGPPVPTSNKTALEDPLPHKLPRNRMQLDFVDPVTGAVSANPTGRLQIRATLPPGEPAWPHQPDHPTSTLREFGLVAQLNGSPVLINYRTHTAIAKDPASTLERTIWLVF